jgi:hypothetical protein
MLTVATCVVQNTAELRLSRIGLTTEHCEFDYGNSNAVSRNYEHF